ncbi:hypothetical protein [Pelagicoccus sp. SDUM812003]|uniref:hypothetical protein n=1 Tax=Pelagicoccus sp. SDUM812003 TaxID=3041267 RepID=UPI00280C9B87|nr:hypothetical protein [Pelagicoccus sp. SDUM812003]MDQ8202915.1 hypothetical protein [Pelagicoccus sp. SDUM812003]
MLSNSPRSTLIGAACLLFLFSLAGCASVQNSVFPIGSVSYPAKPKDAAVDVFREELPSRDYQEIARLNVHLEKTFFIKSAFAEALPRLQQLAREQGADAIIEIEEERSQLNETFIYNVKAVAIVFTD